MAEKPKLLGITGNIASGKSVVRQYLENEGALTIDADLLAQETYLPGNPAYQPILDTFGSDICYSDGQINRSKLGRIVFREPSALAELEAIVHPQVTLSIEKILDRAQTQLVVVEAIKLFEANLHLRCDQVWAVVADDQVRQERLMITRGLSEEDALTRIHSQNPQEEKAARAHYVVHTDTSFEFTYTQTIQGLKNLLPKHSYDIPVTPDETYQPLRPAYFNTVREVFNHYFSETWTDEYAFHTLSQRSVLIGIKGDTLTSMASWKIDHFLGLVHNIIPCAPNSEETEQSIHALEHSAKDHLCNALFLPHDIISPKKAKLFGYMPGEYYPSNLNAVALTNFLRRHGYMPGEVYLKTQF
ncbi:MAG: dephospho-CoA kinase [Anaerolineaceae bacterium]